MNIQAEVSLYPLRTEELAGPIETFCQTLVQSGLEVQPGAMSTRVSGDCEGLFAGLGRAFGQIAEHHDAVLVIKVSNCCAENNSEGGSPYASESSHVPQASESLVPEADLPNAR